MFYFCEIENTNVGATTLHNLFDLSGSCESKLDFTKLQNEKVKALIETAVIFLDEATEL